MSNSATTGKGDAVLTSEQLADYQTSGLIKMKMPNSVTSLERQFLTECATFLDVWGNVQCSPGDIPAEVARLAKENRELVARLYKASRRFPSVKALAAHPFFVNACKQLMATDLVSCCNFVCVRIDLPDEDKFLTPIHQDFPYIQGSLNGVTIWLPFHNMTAAHGIPSLVPESHKLGLLKVTEYNLGEVDGSGGRSFTIADEKQLLEANFDQPDHLDSDEGLIFHTLLLHRSENNVSNEARLSIQVRFDDLTNEESFRKNFPEGLYLQDHLADTYPEYVVD